MPRLGKVTFTKFTGAPMGDAKYYLQCDMFFNSLEDLSKAIKSPEGRATGKDLMSVEQITSDQSPEYHFGSVPEMICLPCGSKYLP